MGVDGFLRRPHNTKGFFCRMYIVARILVARMMMSHRADMYIDVVVSVCISCCASLDRVLTVLRECHNVVGIGYFLSMI